MSIELRLSNVSPPTAEPSRTLYRDIVNLPDPVLLGITARYFNHDSVTLYFQITGSGTGYTFGTVSLGSLAAGTDAYQNLDQFASRAKPSASALPSGEMEETVTLTLSAYTDAGYSVLKWTFTRTVTIHWINSADPAFSVDELDNFDDGTVQGWVVAADGSYVHSSITLAAATDYVLSPPYSLKVTDLIDQAGSPNDVWLKYLQILSDSASLVYLGRPYDTVLQDYLPTAKWMRIIVPLTPNITLTLKILQHSLGHFNNSLYADAGICLSKQFTTANKSKVFAIMDMRMNRLAIPQDQWLWLDDFKIISK